jgi:outer membrane PBP1 activator LpoA protein
MRIMPPKKSGLISRWLLLAVVTAMAGCAALPPPTSEATPENTEQRAGELARAGNHAQAAAAYQAIATSRSPPQRADFQLRAVSEWLAANRPGEAAQLLARIDTPLTGPQAYDRSLLDAETSLIANRAQEAWQKVSSLAANAAYGAALRYYTLKIRIALAAARPLDAIQAEIDAERFATSAADRTALRSLLLAELRDARDRGLRLDPRASNDPIVRGWLELGATATRGPSLANLGLAAHWRATYPNHPAAEIIDQAFPSPLIHAPPGGRVALLLPLTGPAAPQAIAVRDGFLSALYQLPAQTRPALRLYDTAAEPIPQVLAEARSLGSTFIVGPLVRENVAALAALGNQPVPVLALNFLPTDQAGPSGLYQFALSPEEEAQLVAQRILADGHHHGIAVVPRGDFGRRVMDAFVRALGSNGSVTSEVDYDPVNYGDFGDRLRVVLRISDSEARHDRLERALGSKLNFEPRHRADLDFVFIAAPSAIDARLIEPQLRYFNYGSDIPTYSLSNAYEPDSASANQDIIGLTYPDMPWMVTGGSTVDGIRTSVGQLWGTRTPWRSRLFAFGYDACQLMLAMSGQRNPADVRVDGLTGQLHFDAARRVQRELLWVHVDRDGAPRLLTDPAAPPARPATSGSPL